MQMFDLIFDSTQYTNVGLFGAKFLAGQDNYMMEAFLSNIDKGF